MSKMHKKFNEIQFLPSKSTDDVHFINNKPKLETITLPKVPPPNAIITTTPIDQQQIIPTTLVDLSSSLFLNNAFNNLNVVSSASKRAPRNALLNSLLNPQQQQQQQQQLEPHSLFDQASLENIEKLRKVDKLRDRLRVFKRGFSKVNFDDKKDQNYVDICDLMFNYCRELGIFIEYKSSQTVDCGYYGVLYLDQYKISSNAQKKKKKCKLFTYKDAFNLLISGCILAVRSIQNYGQAVEYELYNIDGGTTFSQYNVDQNVCSYNAADAEPEKTIKVDKHQM